MMINSILDFIQFKITYFIKDYTIKILAEWFHVWCKKKNCEYILIMHINESINIEKLKKEN